MQRKSAGTAGLDPPRSTVAWLAIWGMYSPDCQTSIEATLRRMRGVLDVEVDWHYMRGRVVYDPDKVSIEELIECIGGVQTSAAYRFWAAAGPDIALAVQQTWELRAMR